MAVATKCNPIGIYRHPGKDFAASAVRARTDIFTGEALIGSSTIRRGG
jgi:hypothetical protein